MKINNTEKTLAEFREKLRLNELTKNTIKNYSRAVRTYLDFCEGDVSLETAIAFKDYLKATLDEVTVNLYINALNYFFRTSGENYTLKCIPIRKATTVENVIRKEEYDELRRRLIEDNDRNGINIIALLGGTGMRVSELVNVTLEDVERGYKDIPAKNKTRTVIFPKSVKLIIEQNAPENPSAHIIPMTVRGVQKKLATMAEKYGIRRSVMHPHSFRHFFAVQFLKHDKDISLLSDLLGHSNISTTSIYLTLSREQQTERLNDVMNKIMEDSEDE